MNDWLERIEECMVEGKVTLKVSFDLIANFSFVAYKAHQVLKEKKMFTYDGNYETRFKANIEGLFIEPNLQIMSCNLDEHPVENGYYEVDIICEYTVPDDFHKQDACNDNSRLSPLADRVFDFFKLTSTLHSRVSILVPATLNLRIKCGSSWKRVTQKGGGQPNVYPCNPEEFKGIIDSLPAYFDKINGKIGDKKTLKILSIYHSGLRFKNNHFHADAFINFYKIIELIFKDKSMFSKKYVEVLNKPTAYEKAMKQSSQKIQMLFIWEYLNKLDESNDEELLSKLLDLAETRNDLAHSSGDNFDTTKLDTVHVIANFMLHHFVLE
ncbi:hypothetical protein ACSTK0_19475 [Vibrio parahaemolyticus]